MKILYYRNRILQETNPSTHPTSWKPFLLPWMEPESHVRDFGTTLLQRGRGMGFSVDLLRLITDRPVNLSPFFEAPPAGAAVYHRGSIWRSLQTPGREFQNGLNGNICLNAKKNTGYEKLWLLLFATVLFGSVSGQCKNIKYRFPGSGDYKLNDSIIFVAKNYCKEVKYVLFSLECKEGSGNWQEIDNDIFTLADKGMKIIGLQPMKLRKFSFRLNNIDTILFRQTMKATFRIIENLYSGERTQILRTKVVKRFTVAEGRTMLISKKGGQER